MPLPIKRWLPAFIALALGALLLPGLPGTILGGDAHYYDATARQLLATRTYAEGPGNLTVFRAPGYSLFLAAVYLFTTAPLVVRVLQFGLLALTAYAVMDIGDRRFGRPVGGVAAVLVAGYVPFGLAATMHLSETLTLCLAVGAVWAFERRRLPLAGLLLGIATLTRPPVLIFALPAVALLSEPKHRRGLLLAALACCALIIPWLIRQALLTGRPLLGLSASSAYASSLQYNGQISYQMTDADWKPFIADWDERFARYQDLPLYRRELAVESEWASAARATYHQVPPTRYLTHFPKRVLALWGVGSAASGWKHRLAQAQWIVLAPFTLFGLWWERRRLRHHWALWWPAVALTLMHLYFHIEPRYSFPARPLLLIYAAVGLVVLWKRGSRAAPNTASEAHPTVESSV